jgi:hypothetical protein
MMWNNVLKAKLPLRFEVLTAVKISTLVFWVVTPCGLVGRYQRFGGTHCHHLQHFGRLLQYVPPKRWYIPTSPHGVTTQKTSINAYYLCFERLARVISTLRIREVPG